jgi:hypothetical protein
MRPPFSALRLVGEDADLGREAATDALRAGDDALRI